MYKKDFIIHLEALKKQAAEKYPALAQDSCLSQLLSHLQKYLASEEMQNMSDYSDVSDIDFLDFLDKEDGRLDIWKNSFQDKASTQTALFWDSPFNGIFNGKARLRLMGVSACEIDTLARLRLLREYLTYLQDDFAVLQTTLAGISHYKNHLDEVKFWELVCLSNKPQALESAFANLGVTRDIVNSFGEHPVHLAALSNSRMQLQQALALGCDVNQPTSSGKKYSANKAATALHLAARYNYRDMALFLLNNHADPTKADADGKLPRDWAREAQAKEVLELLDGYLDKRPNKVTVYIDLGIETERYGIPTIKELEQYGSNKVLKQEVSDQASVDFQQIARRLACASAHGNIQVGETIGELKEILGQHSFYKHASAYYAVQLQVCLEDLVGPFSEQDLANLTYSHNSNGNIVLRVENSQVQVINAGNTKHWVLKPNANISAENIQGITLCVDRYEQLQKVNNCVNPRTSHPDAHLSDHANNLRSQIREFLHDETFWANHVYGFKAYLDTLLIPYPVQQMQDLCATESSFNLKAFQKIAQANCPNEYSGFAGYAYSFFSADTITKSFYRAVMQASNLYDVMQWINKHRASLSTAPEPVRVLSS